MNSIVSTKLRSPLHLFDCDAALHAVKNALGAALRAYPETEASQFRQRPDDIFCQAVGSGDTLEGNMKRAGSYLFTPLLQPSMVDGEDIVRDPEHVGLVSIAQPFQLVGHKLRLATTVCLAVDLVTAPFTVIGTAPRRDQRNGTHAMMGPPGFDIAPGVDGFSFRPRLCVEILDLWSGGVRTTFPSLSENAMPRTVIQPVASAAAE